MNTDLKSILKTIKLNESAISMVLGALVIIIVGVLVVNYFKGKDNGSVLPSLNTEEGATTETPTKGKSYTVKEGDTLWSISETSYGDGFSWTEIAKENKITNGNSIKAGQVLSIPEVSKDTVATATIVDSKTTSAPEQTITSAPTSDPIAAATYTVAQGDNLWKIAVRAYGDGYKWSEVAKENKLTHPNLIHPGNVLILPR